MAKFFIDRPVFAWVLALIIALGGILAILQLPIAQYPNIAPPIITVSTTYPGASAKTIEDSVVTPIEQELNGAPNLLYYESQANRRGRPRSPSRSRRAPTRTCPWRCRTAEARGSACRRKCASRACGSTRPATTS
jgi:hypothetical protein